MKVKHTSLLKYIKIPLKGLHCDNYTASYCSGSILNKGKQVEIKAIQEEIDFQNFCRHPFTLPATARKVCCRDTISEKFEKMVKMGYTQGLFILGRRLLSPMETPLQTYLHG